MEKRASALAGMHRRVEVWRPIDKCSREQLKTAKALRVFGGIEKALINVDQKLLDLNDMVADSGLQEACECYFKGTGRPAVFDYIAIGTDGTAESTSDTALGAEYMRVQDTYSNDETDSECSMDAEFSIDATKALQKCGLFNDPSAGTMYCRDTYDVKNVNDVTGEYDDSGKLFRNRK